MTTDEARVPGPDEARVPGPDEAPVPGPDEAPVPLVRLLRDLAAATLHLHAAAADRAGIAPSDLAALHQLAGGPLTHRELGERLGLRPASTTTVVERLVGRGHAERRRSTDDRRAVLVTSTDAGRSTARGALAGLVPAVRRLEAGRDAHEHAVIAGFLTDAVAVVSAAAADPGQDRGSRQH